MRGAVKPGTTLDDDGDYAGFSGMLPCGPVRGFVDAAKTIDRIIGVFPKVEESAIRTRLAQSFRRIISQRLMPKVGGGRIAAIEILVSNSRTREYIEKGEKEGRSIVDAMNDGELEGMQTFERVLEKFIREGSVRKEIAVAYASNQNNLLLSISDLA